MHKEGISNAMNNFLCTVGKDLAGKIDVSPNPLLSKDFDVNRDNTKFNRGKAKDYQGPRDQGCICHSIISDH